MLGELLKQHRVKAGLTHQSVATRIKMASLSTIYKIEADTLLPSPQTFYGILKLYKLNDEEMYETENEFYMEKSKRMGMDMRAAKKKVFK